VGNIKSSILPNCLQYFSLGIFLLIQLDVFSQGDLVNESKYSIGVNFSPDFCYRNLVNNENDPVNKEVVNTLMMNRDNNEFAKIGYTCGALIKYKSNKKWAWESGIQISNLGYSSRLSTIIFPNQIDPTKGFVKPTPDPNGKHMDKMKWVYSHNYITIPIRIYFNHGYRKLKFVTSAGVSGAMLLNSTIRNITKYTDGSKERGKSHKQKEEYNKFNLFLMVSAGASYQIRNNIHLVLESKVNYGTLKIINTPLTVYLWNTGLSASCYYTLPKNVGSK